jgi:superfamily II DNA or RNA helicase
VGYTSEVEEADRAEAGITKVLSNCAVLNVGVDIPCLSCVQIVKTMGSYIDYAQSMGRVMRPFPGKEFAVILDHSGAVDRHGFPDEDTEWALDYNGTVEERNKNAKKDGKRREPIVCPRCACLFSGTTTCPNCHHELPTNRKKESVLTQSELLVECQRGEAAKTTVEGQLARACTEWSKFVRIAAHKGRTVGMASVMFRSLFKCWPEKYPGLGERLRGGPWRLPDGWQMRHPAMDVYGHAVKGGA